jgi:Asp/Glu/hydantoin racemase
VLLINPNTSEPITRLLQEHVQRELGPALRVRAATARFGAPYIADEATYAVAGHAVLDAWQSQAPADAVLIGCFGDPGLFALRESSAAPVTGLAEAAFSEAASHGRFAVVTGGARWEPMLLRLAQALGFERSLAGIHVVPATGAELAADRDAARRLLALACVKAARRFDAKAVIIGGAALAGMAADLQPGCGLPLIDSVAAGARRIAAALRH